MSSIDMIVDVQCEDESVQIAKVIGEKDDLYEVRFLEKVRSGVFDFNESVETITKDSVSGFYDVERLEETGIYLRTVNGYELVDDSEDEDYECTDVETEDDDDISLVDEDDLDTQVE